jgi:hypothetical protein
VDSTSITYLLAAKSWLFATHAAYPGGVSRPQAGDYACVSSSPALAVTLYIHMLLEALSAVTADTDHSRAQIYDSWQP